MNKLQAYTLYVLQNRMKTYAENKRKETNPWRKAGWIIKRRRAFELIRILLKEVYAV